MAQYIQQVIAGAINRSKTFTASNGDATRMLAAAKAYYGQVPDGSGGMRDMTDNEAIDAIFNDVIKMIIDRTNVTEKKVAEKVNVESITPIVFT